MSSTAAPSTAAPSSDDFGHANGCEAVVVEISSIGGIRPPDPMFLDVPSLVVTGDGRLIDRSPHDGNRDRLVTKYRQRSISEDGIQRVLALADENGLLDDVEYADPPAYDAPFTSVRITVEGVTYEHDATALVAADDESDPGRAALSRFVDAVYEIEMLVGDEALGDDEPYVVDKVLVRAHAGRINGDVGRAIDWPRELVPLADAEECVEIPAHDVADQVPRHRAGDAVP